MGLIKVFQQIGNGFSKVFHSIGNGLKKTAVAVYDQVLKPTYNKVLKPVAEKVVVPVAKKAITVVNHTIDRTERLADASVGAVENVASLTKSPLFLIGAVGIGVLFLTRR